MKKLTALLLIMSFILTGFSALAAEKYESADSIIRSDYIQSRKNGNIFSLADKNIKFTQSYENITNEKAEIQSAYQVWDEDGMRVKAYPSRSIEIPAGEKATLEFSIENPGKYGLYTLKIENRVNVNGVSYKKTFEECFSVCITLNENNVDPDFGFTQQIISKGYGDADITSALMRKTGANWYREDCLTWGMVEEVKGVLKIPEGAKEKLQKIKDNGLEVICILNGTNGKPYDTIDDTIDAYARYCGFVAEQLDGIVDHFEIWNEWNNKKESYATPATYAKLLTKAYKALKDVNENNTVIGCVTAGIDYVWIGKVLYELKNSGDTNVMDAVSVHCYPWTAENGVDEEQLINDTNMLKTVLKNYSLDIPVFLTEVGFSTFDGPVVWIEPCTEEQQLNSLVLVKALNKAYGWYDKLLQYCFHDRANLAGVESNWGLVNCWQRGFTENPEAELTPYGAKPSYLGVAVMNYFTGGNTELQEMLKDENDRAYMFKFKNNNLSKNVMLCINGDLNTPAQKSIELDTNKVKIYDKYGNFAGEEISEAGTFSFEISSEPMYVVWPLEGTWEEEETGKLLNVAVNENTRTVTISGNAQAPGDLVSVMIVSNGEELDEYDPGSVLYVGQATADDYNRYKLSFVMTELKDSFDVYANSKLRREKQKEDLIFSYSIPEIKVMQDGMDVTSMSDLEASSSVDIELRGFSDLTGEKPALIIAQYGEGKLLFVELDEEAVGDCTLPGSEIKKSFEVKEGVDNIKVMYMNTSNVKPFVASYEIE